MPDDTYLLPTEAAASLRVAPKTLTKWRGLGKGPPYRKLAGGRIRYVARELAQWVETQAVRPTAPDTRPPQPTPRVVHALPPRRRSARS